MTDIQEKLNSGNSYQKVRAALVTSYRGDYAAIQSLRDCVIDSDWRIRLLAVYGLGKYELDDIRRLLIDIADNDTSIKVRVTAVHSLGERWNNQQTIIEYLIWKASNDASPNVRAAAIMELAYSKNEIVVAHLIHMLSDNIANVRSAAVEALSLFHDEAAVRALISTLSDPDASVRAKVAEALRWQFDNSVIDALVNVMKTDCDAQVREAACESLEELHWEGFVRASE